MLDNTAKRTSSHHGRTPHFHTLGYKLCKDKRAMRRRKSKPNAKALAELHGRQVTLLAEPCKLPLVDRVHGLEESNKRRPAANRGIHCLRSLQGCHQLREMAIVLSSAWHGSFVCEPSAALNATRCCNQKELPNLLPSAASFLALVAMTIVSQSVRPSTFTTSVMTVGRHQGFEYLLCPGCKVDVVVIVVIVVVAAIVAVVVVVEVAQVVESRRRRCRRRRRRLM